MSAFGYGLVGLMVLSGWLAWPDTYSYLSALYSGLFAPLIALIIFGALIGRAEFRELGLQSPHWLFLGMTATLGGLVWLCRE